MNRTLKYLIFGALIIFLLYNSVYFEPLDEVIAERVAAEFDPAAYAETAFRQLTESMDEESIPIGELWTALQADPQSTCQTKGRVLGISNKCYFLVKGQGSILEIDEEVVLVGDEEKGIAVRIATEFIFGNAIREASGKVPVSDFASIMNFNKVAEEMNKKVREELIPPFLDQAAIGNSVNFVVAAPVEKDQSFIPPLEVIPISLRLQ